MKKFIATAAIAFGLVVAGVAAPAHAEPIGTIPTPIQHDDCGPEIQPGGGPNDYIGFGWDHWTIAKVTGASASLFWFNDPSLNGGYTYLVRYDAKPGYEIPEGTQTHFQFPAFTDVPCETARVQKAGKNK